MHAKRVYMFYVFHSTKNPTAFTHRPEHPVLAALVC